MAKWGNGNFKDLERFKKDLKKLQNKQEFIQKCAKELAARLLGMVIKETPVGEHTKGFTADEKNEVTKVGGTLRRGWSSKTHEEAISGSGNGKDPVAYANCLTIFKKGSIYTIEIINPVEYASYVEFGHRQTPGRFVPAIGKKLVKGWSPGKFMLTRSEKELRRMAPAILEQKLQKELERCFNGK